MDWKYILSLSPEDVSDQNIEEIYGTLAWHDFDDEVLAEETFVKVIKICQEIMKYKSEQVRKWLKFIWVLWKLCYFLGV